MGGGHRGRVIHAHLELTILGMQLFHHVPYQAAATQQVAA